MILAKLPVYLAMAYLCVIAWNDIRAMKIRNVSVLNLLALYLIHIILMRLDGLPGDLMAGILLFLIGFGMWLAKGMGAGDVKLMFVIGLFTGYFALPVFGALLFVISIVLYLIIWLCAVLKLENGIAGRLTRMKTEGTVPYAVPLTLAAIPSMLLGLYGPS